MRHLLILQALVILMVGCVTSPELTKDASVASSSETIVPYTLGDAEFYGQDSIVISSISGPSVALGPGGPYKVRGNYSLSTKDAATLLLSATTSGPSPAGLAETASLAVQHGTGEFEFEFTIAGQGHLHLTYYDVKTGRPFGGVYFGQREGVLKQKSWRYDDPTSELSQ